MASLCEANLYMATEEKIHTCMLTVLLYIIQVVSCQCRPYHTNKDMSCGI
jgi:hypothetical protein